MFFFGWKSFELFAVFQISSSTMSCTGVFSFHFISSSSMSFVPFVVSCVLALPVVWLVFRLGCCCRRQSPMNPIKEVHYEQKEETVVSTPSSESPMSSSSSSSLSGRSRCRLAIAQARADVLVEAAGTLFSRALVNSSRSPDEIVDWMDDRMMSLMTLSLPSDIDSNPHYQLEWNTTNNGYDWRGIGVAGRNIHPITRFLAVAAPTGGALVSSVGWVADSLSAVQSVSSGAMSNLTGAIGLWNNWNAVVTQTDPTEVFAHDLAIGLDEVFGTKVMMKNMKCLVDFTTQPPGTEQTIRERKGAIWNAQSAASSLAFLGRYELEWEEDPTNPYKCVVETEKGKVTVDRDLRNALTQSRWLTEKVDYLTTVALDNFGLGYRFAQIRNGLGIISTTDRIRNPFGVNLSTIEFSSMIGLVAWTLLVLGMMKTKAERREAIRVVFSCLLHTTTIVTTGCFVSAAVLCEAQSPSKALVLSTMIESMLAIRAHQQQFKARLVQDPKTKRMSLVQTVTWDVLLDDCVNLVKLIKTNFTTGVRVARLICSLYPAIVAVVATGERLMRPPRASDEVDWFTRAQDVLSDAVDRNTAELGRKEIKKNAALQAVLGEDNVSDFADMLESLNNTFTNGNWVRMFSNQVLPVSSEGEEIPLLTPNQYRQVFTPSNPVAFEQFQQQQRPTSIRTPSTNDIPPPRVSESIAETIARADAVIRQLEESDV
jgi:hypothetical protein